MRSTFGLLLTGTGYLTYIFGGFAITGLLLFGLYTLFIESISNGFMLIGAAVVGAWVVQFLSGLFIASGTVLITTDTSLSNQQH